jgi:hypothetical protein
MEVLKTSAAVKYKSFQISKFPQWKFAPMFTSLGLQAAQASAKCGPHE